MLGYLPAVAQTYPSRPITMVVPFAPGGASDVSGRVLANRMGEILGQRVVIENKPGAGGAIGAEAVVRAAPDGYTLLFWNVGIATTAHLSRLPYDPLRDLQPIGLAGSIPTILAVGAGVQAATLRDLIEMARARPEALNYGSSGIGSSDHLAVAMFESLAGVRLTHIPYRGGAPAVTAAMTGEVQLLGLTAGSVLNQIRSGHLRALAIASDRPYPGLPGVPTAAEAGLPGFSVDVWLGVWAPSGTPRPIVDRVNAAIRQALATDATVAALGAAGIEAASSTTDEFTAHVGVEFERWGRVIRQANIVVQ
ncbi:Bug family tripartite tricarboxylate transporter substrate binding protein [Roseomonas fluvialis]|uniref:Bug family tripartite tricarboxylate transporter substrate binding protein n=1 Tax=Roseomonas fluvialis TaxID=1750527 RepID=UPI001FCDAEB1|nr:tripartite tricarboxylate transporter substrate binding protein [Roseomonas fluvialis]